MDSRALVQALLSAGGVLVAVSEIPDFTLHLFLYFIVAPESEPMFAGSYLQSGLVGSLASAATIAIAFAVVRWSGRIAGRLAPASAEAPLVSSEGLQSVLFSAIGLYTAVVAVPVVLTGYLSLGPENGVFELWPSYAGSIVQALAGVALLLWGGAAAGLWHTARAAGR